MHPDAGAIIGISLAGSVLLVAVLFLCLLNLPCCKQQMKPRTGRESRRTSRPSTSSRSAILNFPFSGSTRNIQQLSALDLHSRSQQYLHGSNTGLANPLWQMQCHSCGMFVTASQHSLNHHHQCGNQVTPCNCCRHHDEPNTASRNNNSLGHSPNNVVCTNTSSFQYSAPQLVPPTESPPPYPGSPYPEARTNSAEVVGTHTNASSSLSPSRQSNPPPYNPKY